jgi:CcmD family protein
MEEFMFQSGKMPVVIAVVLLILLGIFGYLISMERRLSRMERELDEKDREAGEEEAS